jgi:hypothetical protein
MAELSLNISVAGALKGRTAPDTDEVLATAAVPLP